jgi:regulator of replication initiation timing
LEEIQTENMKLKVENQKLSRRIETIRTDNQTILDLEGVGRSFFYT